MGQATQPKTPREWERFNAARSQKRFEDRAQWQKAVEETKALTPRQKVILRNVEKLAGYFKIIARRALDTDNDDMQEMLLLGIQHMGRDAAGFIRRIDDFEDKFSGAPRR